MEDLALSVGGSLIATFIVAIFGKWKGWWLRSKSPESVDLAMRVLKFLDGEGEEKTTKMIYATKQLGDSLVSHYKSGAPYDTEYENTAISLIEEMLGAIKPLVTELSASKYELDDLKRAVITYQKGLEWRAQIVKHLCHPPNPKGMDPGHVRDQLLTKNILPNDLLKSAKGEAAIFLRGHGLSWLARKRNYINVVKKHRPQYKETIAQEHRTFLRTTSLYKSKK